MKTIESRSTSRSASRSSTRTFRALAYGAGIVALLSISELALAAGGGGGGASLGSVATNITGSMSAVAKLITAVSYVAGIGFALMGLLKLKAHKDQPAQVPLSQPFVLLFISAGLLFLPSMITTAGETLWKGEQKAGNAAGEGVEGSGGGGGQ